MTLGGGALFIRVFILNVGSPLCHGVNWPRLQPLHILFSVWAQKKGPLPKTSLEYIYSTSNSHDFSPLVRHATHAMKENSGVCIVPQLSEWHQLVAHQTTLLAREIRLVGVGLPSIQDEGPLPLLIYMSLAPSTQTWWYLNVWRGPQRNWFPFVRLKRNAVKKNWDLLSVTHWTFHDFTAQIWDLFSRPQPYGFLVIEIAKFN